MSMSLPAAASGAWSAAIVWMIGGPDMAGIKHLDLIATLVLARYLARCRVERLPPPAF